MRLDHVPDAQPVLARPLQIELDVALRIDDRRHTFGADHVRGVRQATEVELFEVHGVLRNLLQYRGRTRRRQVFTIVRRIG